MHSPLRQSRRRGRAPAIIGLVLAILLGGLWQSSRSRGHGLFLFGPQGKAGAIISLDGRILLGASNVSFGPSRAWTIQPQSTPAEEMRQLRDAALDTSSRKQAAGFLAAARVDDAFGIAGAWCRLVGFPHWLPMALCLIPAIRWSARAGIRRRRIRRGRCSDCGYDLRGAAGPCPECGPDA